MRSFFIALFAGLALAGSSFAEAPNFRVPSELANAAQALDGRVILGNPQGDVTLVEFFDYNCPYCRRSAQDMTKLIASDPNLKVVLINYPVLGIASIEVARVALAYARQKHARYAAFQSKIYEGRGVLSGEKALSVAVALGANREKLINDANSDQVTSMMKQAAKLGNDMNLQATPSFVVLTQAFVGDPGLEALRGIIASVRKCEKVAC